MTGFDAICNEYGLVQVPDELVGKEIVCCYPPCASGEIKNHKLWTDQDIRYHDTASYHKMIDRIRNNSYCKTHILSTFGSAYNGSD